MAGAMCVGDSASLVDPFTGEGIGNALVSAKLTSKYFDRDKHADGFPADQAAKYMEALWKELGNELSNSYRLQGLVKRKRTHELVRAKSLQEAEDRGDTN